MGWSIVLNPQTLEKHGPNARGVILENGDLYLENISNRTIHNDILKILHEMEILQGVRVSFDVAQTRENLALEKSP